MEVNAPGASERRALHRAAGGNHLEICKYLVDKGATVDIVSLFYMYIHAIMVEVNIRRTKVEEQLYTGRQLVGTLRS